jgi:hypothetical protein
MLPLRTDSRQREGPGGEDRRLDRSLVGGGDGGAWAADTERRLARKHRGGCGAEARANGEGWGEPGGTWLCKESTLLTLIDSREVATRDTVLQKLVDPTSVICQQKPGPTRPPPACPPSKSKTDRNPRVGLPSTPIPIVRSDPIPHRPSMSHSHHDGSKPYQPRRGPERPPQPADGIAVPPPAAVAPSVEHLVAAAAEAEALSRLGAEQQQLLQGHEQEVGEEEGEDEEEDEMEDDDDDDDEQEGQHGGIGVEHVPMDADAAAAAAVAAAGAQMDPHSVLVPGTVPPMATNQLTLSFQGEVYVFDSVSPDKVPLLFCPL